MDRKSDFYERNINKSVNLYTDKGITLSGDIKYYDRQRAIVILTNFIKGEYYPDGTSQYLESAGEFELDTPIVTMREVTTREDRLGRIVRYNQDIEKENREIKNGRLEDKTKSN